MDGLKRKTFYTIFVILTLFAVIFAIFFDAQTYQREYNGIMDNLTRMRNLALERPTPPDRIERPGDNDALRNRKIIDYETYTFILNDDNEIVDRISHNDNNVSDAVINQANEILMKNDADKINIPVLYCGDFAYNLNSENFLVIIDITNVKNMLHGNLTISLVIVGLLEILIWIIARMITRWITEPVLKSFEREKEFVANASHELKTPLAVMMASIDCLKDTPKNKKWIDNLRDESERMSKLITRLLDLSRSEALESKNFKQHNFSILAEKTALTFESLAYDKNIKIKTEIEGGIDFRCNKDSMEELLSILLDNAICHGEKGSNVEVKLTRSKNGIRLSVVNAGEPIPETERERIFERFYRGDQSHNRKGGRYGLGLAIAKNIAEAHGGKIKAFSRNGKTTFEVEFGDKNFHAPKCKNKLEL